MCCKWLSHDSLLVLIYTLCLIRESAVGATHCAREYVSERVLIGGIKTSLVTSYLNIGSQLCNLNLLTFKPKWPQMLQAGQINIIKNQESFHLYQNAILVISNGAANF